MSLLHRAKVGLNTQGRQSTAAVSAEGQVVASLLGTTMCSGTATSGPSTLGLPQHCDHWAAGRWSVSTDELGIWGREQGLHLIQIPLEPSSETAFSWRTISTWANFSRIKAGVGALLTDGDPQDA
jgi:hypothetical protein